MRDVGVAAARDDGGRLTVGTRSELGDRRTSLAGAGGTDRGQRCLAGRLLRGEGLVGGDAGPGGSHGRGRRGRPGKGRVFARLEPGREDWAVRMLRSVHAQKGAGNVDWKTFAAAAKAVLEGRALETIPTMQYVWRGRTGFWRTSNC